MGYRIVSWNILQGGGKRMPGICEALFSDTNTLPDVLCLQEFRHNTAAAQLLAEAQQAGLGEHCLPDSTARTNNTAVLSRYPLSHLPWPTPSAGTIDPALAFGVDVTFPDADPLTLYVGHLPHKKPQVPYFEAFLAQRDTVSRHAFLLGDLNCGIPFEDSETKTFANTHLFQSLLHNDWNDSWRQRHPEAREFTWISTRGNGYRYDHCLATASADALIESIYYQHAWREAGLSDHSAMVIDLETVTTNALFVEQVETT